MVRIHKTIVERNWLRESRRQGPGGPHLSEVYVRSEMVAEAVICAGAGRPTSVRLGQSKADCLRCGLRASRGAESENVQGNLAGDCVGNRGRGGGSVLLLF